MDKGFRRIAITLLGITALSVILVGVYLWYNFNARSNLVLVVPEKSDWYIHVQTKEWMKAFQDEEKPAPLMKFEAKFKSMPIFCGISSPKDVGISPHSDWLFFGKNKTSFLALSVFSESALELFCNRLVDSGFLQPPVKTSLYTRYKIAGKNAYIAFKHKAVVVGLLPDTVEDAKKVQLVFNDVFSGKSSRFLENQELQSLYDKGSAVVAWKSNRFLPSTIDDPTALFSFPFNQSLAIGLENKQCIVTGASAKEFPSYWGRCWPISKPHGSDTSGKISDTIGANQPQLSTWISLNQKVSSAQGLSTLLQIMDLTIERFSAIDISQ